MKRLFAELARRQVFRVAAAYAIVGWLALQATGLIAPGLNLPEWTFALVFFLLILGFPLAVLLAWAFELTPQGVKRTGNEASAAGGVPVTDLVLITLLVVLAGSIIVSYSRQVQPAPVAASSDISPGDVTFDDSHRSSIAVLPFANMSSDPEQEYFSDGITEEILNALAHIDGLKVTSRTSSFALKDSLEDLPAQARKLGVEHILEGSVRRSGDMVRITAQLIRGDDDQHLWSQTFERSLRDIFRIQEEISLSIASALEVQLTDWKDDTHEIAPEVYDLYLRALESHDRGSFADQNLARERLERVVKAEPGFARAHVGLANAILSAHGNGSIAGNKWLDRAEKAAHQALALDRHGGEAYAVLASVAYFRGDLDWSLEHYRRAEQYHALDRHSYNYASLLIDLGRIEEANRLAVIRVARDPLNPAVYYGLSLTSASTGDRETSLSALETIRELKPEDPNSYYLSVNLLTAHGGDVGQAMILAEKAYQLDPLDPEIKTQLALNYLAFGDFSEAKRWIDMALATDPDVGFSLGVKGLILVAQGEKEDARALALRALDPTTGAINFRWGSDIMLIRLAYPDAMEGPWLKATETEYRRHWPGLLQFGGTGTLWTSTNGARMSPASLSAVDYSAHLKAMGQKEEVAKIAGWLKMSVRPEQFFSFLHNSLFFAELAMVEGDHERALDIITAEVEDGFIMCWQWRLRDNPHFAPLSETPRFQAALDGVAKNIERQKTRYTELKSKPSSK